MFYELECKNIVMEVFRGQANVWHSGDPRGSGLPTDHLHQRLNTLIPSRKVKLPVEKTLYYSHLSRSSHNLFQSANC